MNKKLQYIAVISTFALLFLLQVPLLVHMVTRDNAESGLSAVISLVFGMAFASFVGAIAIKNYILSVYLRIMFDQSESVAFSETAYFLSRAESSMPVQSQFALLLLGMLGCTIVFIAARVSFGFYPMFGLVHAWSVGLLPNSLFFTEEKCYLFHKGSNLMSQVVSYTASDNRVTFTLENSAQPYEVFVPLSSVCEVIEKLDRRNISPLTGLPVEASQGVLL